MIERKIIFLSAKWWNTGFGFYCKGGDKSTGEGGGVQQLVEPSPPFTNLKFDLSVLCLVTHDSLFKVFIFVYFLDKKKDWNNIMLFFTKHLYRIKIYRHLHLEVTT